MYARVRVHSFHPIKVPKWTVTSKKWRLRVFTTYLCNRMAESTEAVAVVSHDAARAKVGPAAVVPVANQRCAA